MEEFFSILAQIWSVILKFWWLWGTILLGWLWASLWLAWRQFLYKNFATYTLLEIKIPREAKKSPKAMEHILANLAILRNVQGNFREKWLDGEVTQWFSLELASFGGEIHFYLRTPTRHANVVRANFYGQYPDVELEEVEDYMDRLPDSTYGFYESGYNLWGAELFLARGDGRGGWPIRTYVQFEDIEETRNLDPIAGLLEVLSKINPEEIVVVQILARPIDPREFNAIVKKEVELLKKETKTISKGPLGEEYELFMRTPGEMEKFKFLEAKSSKLGFDVIIRYVYFAPQSIYNVNFAKRGVRSAFYQFGSPSLNFFLSNPRTWTQAWIWDRPHIFPKRILEGRKQRMLLNYRTRAFPSETFWGNMFEFHIWTSSFTQRYSAMNTEEVATIFHLPTEAVLTQPLVPRVESRKVGPPPTLPIFKEERGLPGIMQP